MNPLLGLTLRLDYDLPSYDPEVHERKKTFALLTYRGVAYAKWVDLESRGTPKSWAIG
jgi:hypothetical protein|tara:strand:+ start:226 stop:399 length:174 start_codon:yes stop_codon:yes gene_type:complete